ncbi:GNAT family N-acetyltransferase [Paenibacillus mesophilus]|uniref:GNAT family N-acetyltransferase n=1 Tax=Paenibacillus mesophilus TaxID=2582849 RepID=UPI00110E3EF3|nr:GNAT family N-acyltransferase [Paenibacillus mesophilus]TMV46882.1 GNAT family N-acetyltransferase [Paenibacillus mesophilus]
MSKPLESLQLQRAPLAVKLAERTDEIEQAFRLRYQVFAEEERNANLYNESAMERDRFDDYCDHLIVTDLETDTVIGTYRLLPGPRAMQHGGFYSETEFDLSGFGAYKWKSLELGRSCIAPAYRDGKAIQLLWEGIADYVKRSNYSYLIGCASVAAPTIGFVNELYSLLASGNLITDRFGIRPLETHRINELRAADVAFSEKELYRKLPPLMKGYRWLGAEIAGEPAYDPLFRTADFFIVLETANMTSRYRRRFMG